MTGGWVRRARSRTGCRCLGSTRRGCTWCVAMGTRLGSGGDRRPRQGIRVNEYLESSVPDVWAAGDATCFHDPVYGRSWHVEHWNNAFWHGEIAGANMAGERTAYDHVPNFFSEVLGGHMELFGDPQGWKRTLLIGELASAKFAELYLDADDRVQMVISLNPADDQFEMLEKLARQRPSVRGR